VVVEVDGKKGRASEKRAKVSVMGNFIREWVDFGISYC
jgi:hypothetical protein